MDPVQLGGPVPAAAQPSLGGKTPIEQQNEGEPI